MAKPKLQIWVKTNPIDQIQGLPLNLWQISMVQSTSNPQKLRAFAKREGKKKNFYVTATCSSRGNGTNDFRKWTHLPLPYHSSLSQSPCLMMHHCGSLVVTLATSIVIATTPDRQLSGGFPPPLPFLLTIFMNHDPHHNGINKWMKSTSVDG